MESKILNKEETIECLTAWGAALRRVRRHLNLTLDEVGDRVDMKKPRLSLLENGRVSGDASAGAYFRLASYYGCEIRMFSPDGRLVFEFPERTKAATETAMDE